MGQLIYIDEYKQLQRENLPWPPAAGVEFTCSICKKVIYKYDDHYIDYDAVHHKFVRRCSEHHIKHKKSVLVKST